MSVGKITLVHKDSRRAISEYNDVAAGFSVQQFLVTERLPLGNHYHESKEEVFVIIRGSGTVALSGADGSNRQEFAIAEGSVVHVPKQTVHTFLLEPGSEMLCYSSKPFNANDPDMHPSGAAASDRVAWPKDYDQMCFDPQN